MQISLYEYNLPDLKAGIAKSAECIAHIHLHFEVLYIKKGRVPVMIGGKVYALYPGDCAVILPGILHKHLDGEENDEMFLSVCAPYFAGQYEELIKTEFAVTPVIRKEQVHKNVVFLLQSLVEQSRFRTVFNQQQIQIIMSTFQLLFAYILPQLSLRKKQDSDLSELTQCIIEYIFQNSKRKLSLDIVAEELGVSKYKISKIFANQLYMNFNQYLNLIRIDTAKTMLTTTNQSITTICYESGFSAVRTFNTSFYKITGFTPKEYRKQYLEGKLEEKYSYYLKEPSE